MTFADGQTLRIARDLEPLLEIWLISSLRVVGGARRAATRTCRESPFANACCAKDLVKQFVDLIAQNRNSSCGN
jgi:hypothetical protein